MTLGAFSSYETKQKAKKKFYIASLENFQNSFEMSVQCSFLVCFTHASINALFCVEFLSLKCVFAKLDWSNLGKALETIVMEWLRTQGLSRQKFSPKITG